MKKVLNFKLLVVCMFLFVSISSKSADVKNRDFTKTTFEQPITLESMNDFWGLLMSGYNSVLSDEQSWGTIKPNYAPWIRTPKNIKGDPELVTRTLFGLGAWFSKDNRPSEIVFRNKKINLKALLENAIVNGTDPSSKGYWNGLYTCDDPGVHQFVVEAPAVALAYYLSKSSKKIKFTEKDKKKLNTWLQIYSKDTRGSNWCLFYALTATICKTQGWEYDKELLRKNLDTAYGCYINNGWFEDGKGSRHFDEYNNWVFATFFMYWDMIDGKSYPELSAKIPAIMNTLVAHQAYFYGADGSHPEYGRSITYKFTRLSSILMAYKMGYTDLPVGMIKRIVRLHLQHYIKNGAIDLKTGIVKQRLSKDGSLAIRDSYNYAGSTYWIMQTMGALWMLDDNDPFWSAKEELLPIEKNDFHKYFKIPGWLMVGTKNSKSVVLYNVGTDHAIGWRAPSYFSKYRKNAYHSQLGYVLGNDKYVPCDNMPVLKFNKKSYYPIIDGYSAENSDISILKIKQTYVVDNKKASIKLSTILVVKGESMLRFTKIDRNNILKDAEIRVGGYALGFKEKYPTEVISKNIISLNDGKYYTLLEKLGDEDGTLTIDDDGYDGVSNTHSKAQNFKLPYLKVNLKKPVTLIALKISGSNQLSNTKSKVEILSLNDKEVRFIWYGKKFSVKF